MVQFFEQYNIMHGIFLTFTQDSKKRILQSSHKPETREKVKQIYPYQRYETWTKENLVLAGLMIMLEKKPSSFIGMLEELRDDELIKKVKFFKDIIINYKVYIIEDVNLINSLYGERPSFDDMFDLYTKNSIRFYTLWWFLIFTKTDIDEILKMRVKGSIIKRIKQMNLFLTFKEDNLKKIQELLTIKLDLGNDI
jgi:hypothetical protein